MASQVDQFVRVYSASDRKQELYRQRNRKRSGWHLIALIALLLVALRPSMAQVDTGAIVGTVSDTSGAIISGASVTIEEETTGLKQTQHAGSDGTYSFSPLKLGIYTLTTEKQGFSTVVQQHVQVTVQSRLEINPRLEVGSVSQSVQVTSTGPILETQTSSIQQLVDQRTINNLPLNGRNATFLAQLSPGVTIAQNDSRGLQASGSFTANGARRTQNDYLLDGMDDNVAVADLVNQAQFAVLPPPDALREFTVQTSNYSAEFGHSAGAVLNATTKSGSNRLHGDVWEYLRNDYFDAKDYFVLSSQRKPEFRQNQFGGTLGGPVVIPHLYNGHDRTFFFVDYQGTRIVQGRTYTQTVPTSAERDSGFTNLQNLIALQSGTRTDALGRVFPNGTVFDPATTRTITAGQLDPVSGITATSSGYVRDPFYAGSLSGTTNFAGTANQALLNRLPSTRLNASAIALLKLYPAPTSGKLTNNYTTSPSAVTNINSFDTRFDHAFSDKDSAFVRYSFVYNDQKQPSPFEGAADGGPSRPGTGHTESQNVALSETHVFTPRLVLEARVGYSRVADERRQNEADVLGLPEQYGIPGIPQIPSNGGLPLFSFGQLSNLGSSGTMPSDKASDIFQVSENLSIDRGRNQVRLGTEYQHLAAPTLTPTSPRGNFTNDGTYTSVVNSTDNSTDLAQFVLNPEAATVPNGVDNVGAANKLSASNFPPAYHLVRPYFGAYVQDDWRVLPKLTLNMGLRWEFIGAPEESNGRFANLVTAQSGTSPDGISRLYIPSSQVANVPIAFQNLLAKDGIVFTPVNGTGLVLAQKTNFAPRFGFAYQASPKLVVRAGFGLFFQGNENHGLSVSNYVNFPFQVTTNTSSVNAVTPITPDNSIGALQNGLLNVPLTPAAAASSTNITLLGEPQHAKSSYAQAYNLQVQYQLTPNTIFEVGYVGTGARHVQVPQNANAVSSILPPNANIKANSFFPDFATGGTFIARAGQTNYNSLQANLEHRFSSGFSLLANYTWSKCLGDARDMLDNGIGSYRAPYVPGMGIRADYGLCDIDVRNIVHVSGTYQLPFGRNKRWLNAGPASWITGGWSTNWIFAAQDGQPLTIACTTTNAAGLGCNALKVPGQNPYGGSHNAAQFLNPAAFVNPPAATAASATIANLGGSPTQVTGPPYRRLNLSVFRTFATTAESYFEFRAEVFNLTNTPNFAQPGNLTFTTPNTFAQISNTRDNPNDPRELQFSLKYYF